MQFGLTVSIFSQLRRLSQFIKKNPERPLVTEAFVLLICGQHCLTRLEDLQRLTQIPV